MIHWMKCLILKQNRNTSFSNIRPYNKKQKIIYIFQCLINIVSYKANHSIKILSD